MYYRCASDGTHCWYCWRFHVIHIMHMKYVRTLKNQEISQSCYNETANVQFFCFLVLYKFGHTGLQNNWMDKGSFNRLTNALIFRNCEWRVVAFRSNKISIKNDNEVAGGEWTGERKRERGGIARDAETRNEQGKKYKDTVDRKQPRKKARSRREKRKRHGVKNLTGTLIAVVWLTNRSNGSIDPTNGNDPMKFSNE